MVFTETKDQQGLINIENKLSLAYDQPLLGFVRFRYSSLGFIRAWSFRLEHENVLI